jgi:integrase
MTPLEIDRLIAAARRLGRHGHRDATMILLAYRHGLRVSELIGLRREQVDLRQGLLHVRRRKNGCRAPIRCTGRSCGPCASCGAMTATRPMSSSPSARPR